MSIEAEKQAYEVPLVEQLESVPTDARLVIDDADGMGTHYIPVGRMCHDAAKALRKAIEEAEKREWVGLTDEEIGDFASGYRSGRIGSFVELTESIEDKLKEKNT